MELASRITRLPRAFDPEQGAETLALFPDITGPTAELIEGTAGCSPYLAQLDRSATRLVAGGAA